jgi:hypothetical protein
MTSFEWLALVYFVAIGATGRRSKHWRRGSLYAAGAVALVIVARFTLPWNARAWMPHAYLVLGYWIPAAFTPSPENERFERWLERADARLAAWCHARARHVPATCQGGARAVPGTALAPTARGSHVLELAYLLCYPMVPATFSAVFAWGTNADVSRYWMSVLLAGYACYGTLRWTAARPPRIVTRTPASGGIAAANAYVLARVSHQLTTFPSGHVAVSIAAALALIPVSVGAAVVSGVTAAMIAVAAVAGRYHYAVDVVLGALVGTATYLLLLPL